MRQAVRAIILHDNQLAVMHRNKFGKQYVTLPGGSVEPGETLEQALLREIAEEMSLEVSNWRQVFLERVGQPFGDQHVFLCDYVSGEPTLSPKSEEAAINKLGQNIYTPQWLPLDEVPKWPFVSEQMKIAVLKGISSGFPQTITDIRDFI